HPDRGGLARAVRAEEAVHRAGRHGQVDVIHGQLAATEPLGQPAGRDRGQWCAAAANNTLGWTAPMNVRPSLVISTDTRLVRISWPLPQLPCTAPAEPSSALSTPAFPPDAWSPEVSAEDGSST